VQDWLKGLPMRAWMIKGAKALEAEAAAPKARKTAQKRARKPAASSVKPRRRGA
jgi:hypothetical protein